MKFALRIVFASAFALALVGFARVSQADIIGPYSVDANTMHLWHLDEATTPAVDQAHYTYTSTTTPTKDANQPMAVLSGNNTGGSHFATMGNAGFAGFGTSLNTSNVSQPPPYPANSQEPALNALSPNNGTTDNVDHTFDNPITHAFTMEAIIKIGFNPAVGWSQPQEIISGEGDQADSSDRSWQFRIQNNGTTNVATANPWVLRFQKIGGYGTQAANNGNPGGNGGSTANANVDGIIPSTGPDAIAQDQWYHVAVTFDGNFADPGAGHLQLYWTKLDPANTTDHLLTLSGTGATPNINGWLREQDTDLGFGNEMRDFNGETEPFIGSIDEVRISDIARGADQMMFSVPEPSMLVLACMGLFGLVGCIRRRQ